MDLLNSFDHLLSHQAASLEVKLALALGEEVLETGPQHVHDHDVELVLLVRFVRTDIVQLRDVGLSP